MEIVLEEIGRRFNREWIFKDISYTFRSGESYAILGINGSGKSTLLQLIAGALTPSTGQISYVLDQKHIPAEQFFSFLSLATPYMELIEDYTLEEMLSFHFAFKNPVQQLSSKEMITLLNMEKSKDKQLKYFSSGMKQRVKLVLAVMSDTPILLLDEPTANLDKEGAEWYHQLIRDYTSQRLIIVCSNQPEEYTFCQHRLYIADYKL
mgnify:CR=1 FL=1